MIQIEGEGDIVFCADPVGLGVSLSCVQGHSGAKYVKLSPIERVCKKYSWGTTVFSENNTSFYFFSVLVASHYHTQVWGSRVRSRPRPILFLRLIMK